MCVIYDRLSIFRTLNIAATPKSSFYAFMFEQNIFVRLCQWQAVGLKTGLATLIAVDGSSPRPIGAQIAVAEDGAHCGVISSGCAEEAIIAAALQAVQDGATHITRYGKDSPFLDIELPCGSGLDILFSGTGVEALTDAVAARHATRQTAHVSLADDLSLSVADTATPEAMAYPPDYHLHIFGAGPHFTCFAELAHSLGYRIFAHSTDAAALAHLASRGIDGQTMTHQSAFDGGAFDAHSAVITLFHEHNLEVPILQAALNSEAHFIGALGSRKTHAQRLDILAMQGPYVRQASDIVGPVGLDIGAADPAEIALSIMAQIVAHRRKGDAA